MLYHLGICSHKNKFQVVSAQWGNYVYEAIFRAHIWDLDCWKLFRKRGSKPHVIFSFHWFMLKAPMLKDIFGIITSFKLQFQLWLILDLFAISKTTWNIW